jgi:hypothetical protein
MKYIYLHGFASGVTSSKAQYFDRKFSELNLELSIPDLNQNDFSCLTLTRQIQQTASLITETQESATIIGSSFGGLTAAFLGEIYPQVKRLILLAPAFNFLDFWLPTLGEVRVKEWQKLGSMSVYHYGEKKNLPLHYQFVEDLRKYSLLTLQRNIPTLIFHGVNDGVIPVRASRNYSCDRPWVRFRELNSDHTLMDVLEIIWQEMWEREDKLISTKEPFSQ